MSDLAIESIKTDVLSEINLVVKPGECVAVYGGSGSGKSLFLRAVADIDPHEGEVRLGSIKCSFTPPALWRRRVALLPSESRWWADTVGEHFITPNPPHFDQLGFSSDVMSWQTSRLSSGERQRLALSRMFEMEPSALLLDEPTANLDPHYTQVVEAIVVNYINERKVPAIWVSHDMEQIRRVAQRRFVMKDGVLEQENI